MTVTVTLFHGTAGWVIALLAVTGISHFLVQIQDWLTDRIQVTVSRHRPLLTIRRRWDRPGARVYMGDGRHARISEVYRDRRAGGMAFVFLDGDDYEPPEWAPVSSLSPRGRETSAEVAS